MACPFFSGKLPHGTEEAGENTDGKLDREEVYHYFMLAYPGYTIHKIEDELSWRVVKKMMGYWDKELPSFARNKRIEQILKTGLKVKITETPKGVDADDQLIATFRGQGWL
jgi:hypothetical protein